LRKQGLFSFHAKDVMPAYLSSRLSSLDGDDGDERAPPFLHTFSN